MSSPFVPQTRAILLLLALGLFAPAPVSAAEVSGSDATAALAEGDALFAQARQFYAAKQYHEGNDARAKAIRAYERAIAANPLLFEAHQRLGDVYLQRWMGRGDSKSAVPVYQKALDIRPNDAPTLSRLGLAHLYLEQYSEAIAAFDRAIHLDPRTTDYLFNLGFTYADIGRKREALQVYRQLAATDSEKATSLFAFLKTRDAVSSDIDRPTNFPNPHIELLSVPAGTFLMGEAPGRSVTIRGFYLGKYPVTQAQWRAVMVDSPSFHKDCDQCPVENVSWNDATAFIARLNGLKDGHRYRLPSEAEWEYAFGGGGKPPTDSWNGLNSGDKSQPVGSLKPNGFGLHEMGGHVEEWCMDWWLDDGAVPADGSPVLTANVQKYHVARGASYRGNFAKVATARNGYTANSRSMNTGFRVAAD